MAQFSALIFCSNALKKLTSLTENCMEIEWLKVEVDPELREQFVQKDDAIWTAMLSQYPGFLSKEVWISPEQLSEVVLVIHWASFEQWKAIPSDDLKRTEAQFNQAMGRDTYKIVASARYQVRKRQD